MSGTNRWLSKHKIGHWRFVIHKSGGYSIYAAHVTLNVFCKIRKLRLIGAALEGIKIQSLKKATEVSESDVWPSEAALFLFRCEFSHFVCGSSSYSHPLVLLTNLSFIVCFFLFNLLQYVTSLQFNLTSKFLLCILQHLLVINRYWTQSSNSVFACLFVSVREISHEPMDRF